MIFIKEFNRKHEPWPEITDRLNSTFVLFNRLSWCNGDCTQTDKWVRLQLNKLELGLTGGVFLSLPVQTEGCCKLFTSTASFSLCSLLLLPDLIHFFRRAAAHLKPAAGHFYSSQQLTFLHFYFFLGVILICNNQIFAFVPFVNCQCNYLI